VLSKEIREIDRRHAREKAPVQPQAPPVADGDRGGVPGAAGNAEANGGADVELLQCLRDADLKGAARGAAREKEADLAGAAKDIEHEFFVLRAPLFVLRAPRSARRTPTKN